MWLPITLLTCLLAQEVIISRPLWFGPQAGSPRLPGEGPGLDFALRPGRRGGAPTVALLGAVRASGREADIYGGRIAGAVQIVAIDWQSGQVYHAAAERPGAVPLSMVMKDPEPPAPGEASIEAIETHFNLDLRGHLGLPAQPANYAVFLWLDQMTSPVRVAQLPGPDKRVQPLPKKAGTRVAVSGAAPGKPSNRVRIQAPGAPAGVIVLTLGYRSRELKWRRVTLPGAAGAEVDLSDLLGAGKSFVAAAAETAISNVLVVERK